MKRIVVHPDQAQDLWCALVTLGVDPDRHMLEAPWAIPGQLLVIDSALFDEWAGTTP